MITLEQLRQQLDELDAQLVSLLNRRAELVLLVKEAKQRGNIAVYSPERERQILDRIASLTSNGPFPPAAMERIFINIISATRSLIGDLSVAYLGPEQGLTHEAAVKQFGGNVQYLPAENSEEIFTKVESGDVQYGVLPLRNSFGTLVFDSIDLLAQSKLVIIAEIEAVEQLGLYSSAESLSYVSRIFGTAGHFDICERWLLTNRPTAELVVKRSAAEALNMALSDSYAAAIAPQFLGDKAALNELAVGITRRPEFASRFVVIGRKVPMPSGNDKTTLLCAVKDKAGALRELLQPFAENGITLLKIDSRPMKNHAWECVFVIDCAGHQNDSQLQAAINDVGQRSSYLSVLGSYPLLD